MISIYQYYPSRECATKIMEATISNIIHSEYLMDLCRMYDINPRNITETSLLRLAGYISKKKNISIEQAAIKIWLGEY